jgi:hypothetical protein
MATREDILTRLVLELALEPHPTVKESRPIHLASFLTYDIGQKNTLRHYPKQEPLSRILYRQVKFVRRFEIHCQFYLRGRTDKRTDCCCVRPFITSAA